MTKHNLKNCQKCGKWIGNKRFETYVMCEKCGMEYKRRVKNKSQYNLGNRLPIGTNPNCPCYLGVYIAEQILSKIFKNVQVMPFGNPGYDFICNNDYKIDVKSACLGKHHQKSWLFNINRNKIADYFFMSCI